MADRATRQDKFFKVFETLAKGSRSGKISIDQIDFVSTCEALYLWLNKDSLLQNFNELVISQTMIRAMSKVCSYKLKSGITEDFQHSDLPGLVFHLNGIYQSSSIVISMIIEFCKYHSGRLNFRDCARFILHMNLVEKCKDIESFPKDPLKFIGDMELELEKFYNSAESRGFSGLLREYINSHRQNLKEVYKNLRLMKSLGLLDNPVDSALDKGSAQLDGSTAELSKNQRRKLARKQKKASANVTDKNCSGEDVVEKSADTNTLSCDSETLLSKTSFGDSDQEQTLNIQTGPDYSEKSANGLLNIGDDERSTRKFEHSPMVANNALVEDYVLKHKISPATSHSEHRAQKEESRLTPTKGTCAEPSSGERNSQLASLRNLLRMTAEESKAGICASKTQFDANFNCFRGVIMPISTDFKRLSQQKNDVENYATESCAVLLQAADSMSNWYEAITDEIDEIIQNFDNF